MTINTEELNLRKNDLERRIRINEDKLKNSPQGTLVYRKDGNGYRYYRQISQGNVRTRTYLTDQKEIVRLFEKRLWKAWIKDYQQELLAIEAYLENSPGPEAVVQLLSNEAMLRILQKGYAEWASADYERNTAYPEDLIYEGANGLKVRSKSEGDISFGLDDGTLPCRYEPKLKIGERKVCPDFQIIHPLTRQEFLWEHFGRMDDEVYEQRAYDKIALYKRNGYFPGDNLIITFEDKQHPLTKRKIQLVIEEHFGDWLEVVQKAS